MKRFCVAVALSFAVLGWSGCSGGSSGGNSNPPAPTPTVTSTTPGSGATSVAISTAISATFSEGMSTSTITSSTFAVTASGGGAVAGTVSYSSGTMTATFTPTAKLSYGTTYTVNLTSAMMSSSGVALSAYSWSFTTAGAPPTVSVDFGTAKQVIRGFGGSEAWSGAMPSTQIATLFGTTASGDLGLSIMRVRIAPATWNSTTQTADTSQWTAELTNAKAAQDMGAIVFATPWTPPASMKSDSSVNSGSLNASGYADFANYLEAYVNYATNQGVNLYAISMQNEPDFDPCGTGGPTAASCYESCLWTAAQMDTWVSNNSSVLTTKLIMPESSYFNSAMSDPSLNDPNAADKIAIIGGHLYGTVVPYYYTLAENLNKDVWMTEHTVNLASGETTTQSMADALSAATEIHNSMTVGQYNAYVYWWMVNSASLSYYSGVLDTNGNMTYFGAAIAQFSRFVRPGYSRYNATANPVTGVYISAYGGSGHFVIVAINTSASAADQAFTIQNGAIAALTPYQTTSKAMVAAQTAVTVTGNQFTYTLPAQSITTFVQ